MIILWRLLFVCVFHDCCYLNTLIVYRVYSTIAFIKWRLLLIVCIPSLLLFKLRSVCFAKDTFTNMVTLKILKKWRRALHNKRMKYIYLIFTKILLAVIKQICLQTFSLRGVWLWNGQTIRADPSKLSCNLHIYIDDRLFIIIVFSALHWAYIITRSLIAKYCIL